MSMSIKNGEVGQTVQSAQNTSSIQSSINHIAKPTITHESVSNGARSTLTETKMTPEKNMDSEMNTMSEKNIVAEKKVLHEPKATHKNMEKTEDKENKQMKQLIAEIEKSSGKIEVENTGLEFSIHEGTNRIMIRVINEETKEVVREVPGEKVLNAIAKIIDLSGIFVDEKR